MVKIAWSNRIALLGTALCVSSFAAALMYVLLSNGTPAIELPLKSESGVPFCPTQNLRQTRRLYKLAKAFERKGMIRDAAQAYSDAIKTSGRPKFLDGLQLWDDYAAFLRKNGAIAAADKIKKQADLHRETIIDDELEIRALQSKSQSSRI